jgi:U3 small nucleolar RNA-associated protein 20
MELRPTYDLMAPLLGKHRQRPHIARFSAEAMSFLVKKAGAPAHREKALPLIIQHAKLDLQSISGTKEFGLYYHGLMTLFAEAMKGNGLTVHTSGPAIFRALVLALKEEELSSLEQSSWVDVICGVLTSIIHHTSSDTFKDVQQAVIAQSNFSIESFIGSETKHGFQRLLLSARLIAICAGVRKGTRVSDWPGLLKSMSGILGSLSKNVKIVEDYSQLDMWTSLVHSVSITLQYAPMDALIPFISPFMDGLTKDPLAEWFLTFCSYLSEAEPERFKSIVLPYFQRFVQLLRLRSSR